jgi:hypothetical protein
MSNTVITKISPGGETEPGPASPGCDGTLASKQYPILWPAPLDSSLPDLNRFR